MGQLLGQFSAPPVLLPTKEAGNHRGANVSRFPCRVYEIACSSNTKGTVCFLSKTNIKYFPLCCCPKGCLVPSASVLAKATGMHGWGLSEPKSPSHGQEPCRSHIPAHVDKSTGAAPGQETPRVGPVGSLAPIHGSPASPPDKLCHRSGLDKLEERKEGAEHELCPSAESILYFPTANCLFTNMLESSDHFLMPY